MNFYQVLEDLRKTPDVGNMRYKSGSAALKHGTETNASDLRLSSVILVLPLER